MTVPFPLLPRPLRWGGVVLVAAVICYFSLLAVPPETPAPGGLALPTWRHVLAYFGLGLSVAYAIADWPLSRRRKALLIVLIVTGYGAAIELGQAFVPERHASLTDVLINGVAAATSLVWYLLEPRVRFVHVGSAEPTEP